MPHGLPLMDFPNEKSRQVKRVRLLSLLSLLAPQALSSGGPQECEQLKNWTKSLWQLLSLSVRLTFKTHALQSWETILIQLGPEKR